MGSEEGGESDGGEQTNTRFPLLARVRTLVATVVTVLAAVVVLMVIIAVNRPEKIVVYIDYGYIQAEQIWWKETQTPVTKTRSVSVVAQLPCRRQGTLGHTPHTGSTGVTNQDIYPPGYVDDCEDRIPKTLFVPVDKVELSVTVTAYNPSGRGKMIPCNITAIRILDVDSSYTGVAIGSVPDQELVVFPVLPRTTYTKRWRVTINGTDALAYLYRRYQQKTSFTTMVQVDVNYSEKVGNISVYYSPVTLGYGVPSASRPEQGTSCQTSQQMVGYNVTWYPPPPP